MSRFVSLSAALLCACATAPVAPAISAAPASAPPADPAPVTEGDVTAAHLGGLEILIKRLPGADLAAIQLYVRGGASNWSRDDAGIEALAFRVATSGGTSALDKEAFGRRLASLGGELSSETGRDASTLSAKGPLASFDALFGLLADTFLRPTMAASEVELARQQQLLVLKRQEENPDGRLQILANATFFKGLPYENAPDGTQESVAKLSQAQLVKHLARLRESSRLLLVVAGDVAPDHVLELARPAFGGLPRGSWSPAALVRPSYAAPALATEARALPTNYLMGEFVAPGPADPDYPAARVATAALQERVFEEVRTKRNLSYAPSSYYDVAAGAALAGIYVSAVDPNTTLQVMFGELRKLQETPIGEVELAGVKAQFRTGFLMRAETTDGQAGLLANGVLLTGDWHYSARLLDQVRTVTAADVQAYAKRYVGKIQMVLLGDTARLDPKLATSL
jgi:zinc protease